MRIRSRGASVAVLNASFEPLGIVTLHRAMVFLARERATVIEAVPDAYVQTAGDRVFNMPRVIAFRDMVRSVSAYSPMPWSRRGLLVRDEHRCAYCGAAGAATVDHVLPRSRGGRNAWLNTVAACGPCNGRKADRTPEEAGMELLWQPREVTRRDTLVVGIAQLGADLEAIGLAV
ncbi:HNH endonuclease [Brevibacterium oceani]|uniref:HNH endonuclease n=1 Tax=Brevibacterium oceani TaxID=358099 RepID=UPI0015E69DD5|nr:HNH endonuclease [Brevibacterium oceani]